MFLIYLGGLLVLGFLVRGVMRQIKGGNGKSRSMTISRVTGSTFLILAIIALVADKWPLALVFAVLGFWIMGNAALRRGLSGLWPDRANSGVSRMRSAMIEMEIDNATNELCGQVLAGDFIGQQLNDLSRAQCMGLYRSALHLDGGGARLLEAYFDRRFAGWRAAGQNKADAGGDSLSRLKSGNMSEDEAYEVLGLRRGAGRDDVVRAHRGMMKKWHPDRGGTTDVAARINEAKDMLLRLHH
ncbi:MAG: molecular chaperone DnaJ [Hyphomicrobiales bacterium]|nr:molecular chaperone DnaJ [Hyphomicrobiales bacterium]MDE2114899.1 molecular chaperone DnaJ [Hyphomicrobiales bacterium]